MNYFKSDKESTDCKGYSIYMFKYKKGVRECLSLIVKQTSVIPFSWPHSYYAWSYNFQGFQIDFERSQPMKSRENLNQFENLAQLD